MVTRIEITRRPPADRADDQNERTSVEPSPIDIVRQAIREAEDKGEPRPGRGTLVQRTGLKNHVVQAALLALAAEEPDEDDAPDTAPPQPRFRSLRHTWPLLFIALAAGVSVWSGWVGLGQLTGFGLIEPFPGVTDWRINSSIVLPISVEAYGAYALSCWLAPGIYSDRTVQFAGVSALISLGVGALAQVAYHLMSAAGIVAAPWQITALVACVPVAVLGLASALAKMVTADRRADVASGEAVADGS